MPADLYRKLQIHLDTMPVAFPRSEKGLDLKILKHLFTPQQAEIALALSMFSEPLSVLHKRLVKNGVSLSEEKLLKALKVMSEKGIVLAEKNKVQPHFSKAMFAIGIYEFQVDKMSAAFDQMSREYADDIFFEQMFQKNSLKQMRTIPIGETVQTERKIGNYDNVLAMLGAESGPFAIINCVCKQGRDASGAECKTTTERRHCLMLGASAASAIEDGTGVEVSRSEMKEMLVKARKHGLVLQPENTQKPGYICCCCGCCCLILSTIKKMEKPAELVHSNFYAEIKADLCSGCRVCVTRCPMGAIDIDEHKIARLNPDRCIGCGVCVSTFSRGAVLLYTKNKKHVPPRSRTWLYARILEKRYGLFSLLFFLIKRLFGRKV